MPEDQKPNISSFRLNYTRFIRVYALIHSLNLKKDKVKNLQYLSEWLLFSLTVCRFRHIVHLQWLTLTLFPGISNTVLKIQILTNKTIYA